VSKTDVLDLLGVCFIAAAAGLVDPRLSLLVIGVALLLMSRSATR
jgi:hypothetical protein